jgi:sugar (pentulose or hexulose) kinase
VTQSDLFERLLPRALEGDRDAGGLLSIGYVSGEHITGFSEGRPLFVRGSGATFTLANFIRAHLYSSLCVLRIGLEILHGEGAVVDELRGHGGFFKTGQVGQRMMATAADTPISLPHTAGEGGAWGMALLAAFVCRDDKTESLADFLDRFLAGAIGQAMPPESDDVAGFYTYLARYKAGLSVEAAAVESLE